MRRRGPGPAVANDLVGRRDSELQLTVGTRVIGRDGTCLGARNDSNQLRLNLVIEDGVVLWAARF